MDRDTIDQSSISDLFHTASGQNFFYSFLIDVPQLYKKFPIDFIANTGSNDRFSDPNYSTRFYRLSFLPERYRVKAWVLARRIHIDLLWFLQFRSYWVNVLGGRPLWGVEDFYFLRNIYRTRFQDNQVPDTEDANIHLQAWQQPELLYQLFHLVYKEKFACEVWKLRLTRKLLGRWPDSIIEYGCGTAPITTSLFEFFKPDLVQQVYVSDIQTLAFHYAAYKFRERSNVLPVLLVPENNFQLELEDETVEVIYCVTVFEHLNSPVETIRAFYNTLKKGGLLFFDYIKEEEGHAHGLDTQQALLERESVLDFIEQNFDIVHGEINRNASVSLTVGKKKAALPASYK